MNGLLCSFLDAPGASGLNQSQWAFISGLLALVVGGIIVGVVQRRWNREDKQEEKEKAELKAELSQLGLGLSAEREERIRDIVRESNDRRVEGARLGRDISRIREEFAYFCGQTGKARPKFGE